jgi:hypothetical protein
MKDGILEDIQLENLLTLSYFAKCTIKIIVSVQRIIYDSSKLERRMLW